MIEHNTKKNSFCTNNTRAVFFSTSDHASKEVRNTREPDLCVT